MQQNPISEICDRATVAGLGYLVLISWLRPTIATLTEVTGQDRGTTMKMLKRLESRGLIARIKDGHADRFYLAQEAEQLPLPQLSRIATVGGSSSSSYVVLEMTQRDIRETTTTTPETVENHNSYDPTAHPAKSDLVRFLVDDIGCPSRRIAGEAIDTALNEGAEPLEIKYEALWWWMYWASGDGRGIDNIGLFIARKIQGGECVREGYRYNERKAREINSRLVDLFLEVEHIYKSRRGNHDA